MRLEEWNKQKAALLAEQAAVVEIVNDGINKIWQTASRHGLKLYKIYIGGMFSGASQMAQFGLDTNKRFFAFFGRTSQDDMGVGQALTMARYAGPDEIANFNAYYPFWAEFFVAGGAYDKSYGNETRLNTLATRIADMASIPIDQYGFDIYDTQRVSVIPKFSIVDAFTIAPGEVVNKAYADPVLVSEVQAGRINITLFESPTLGPTMLTKPIQANKSATIGQAPVLTELSPASKNLKQRIDRNTAERNSTVSTITSAIPEIDVLCRKYGVLLSSSGASYVKAIFEITPEGYFFANWYCFYGTVEGPSDFAGFNAEFRGSNGAYGRTYGLDSLLRAQTDTRNALIIEVQANPIEIQTPTGAYAPSMIVSVNGGNMQSRIIVLASGTL